MAETYLNLLNSAAAVSANVYDQIDKSMTQRLNVESQAGRFQVESMQKAAQFAEQQRMNDEQIINMRTGNYLNAQKLEAEKLLIPVKLETANLQLEAQRLALQRAREQEGKNHFNSLTSIYDDQIGYALLQTESPEMAQEYIGYKAQVSDYVAKGGKFDPLAFEESLKTIRSKYDAVHPSSVQQVEYNPQTSYLLGQVSPKLQSEYDKRHPLVQGSRNSVANNFYNMDDKALGAFMNSGTLDKLYQPEEVGQLWTGRIAVQQNYADIERLNKELDRERNGKANARARMADPAELVEYDKNIAQYMEQIRTAMDQNMKIAKDSSMGKYGIQSPIVPPIAGGTQQNIVKPSPPSKALSGIEPSKYPDAQDTQQQMFQGYQDTYHAISGKTKDVNGNDMPAVPIQATELSQLDLSWYQKQGTGEPPSLGARDRIKEKIESGVDALVGDDLSRVNEVVTRDKINNLLGTLKKNTEIPISPALAKTLNSVGKYITGTGYSDESAFAGYDTNADYQAYEVPTIVFGPQDKGILGTGLGTGGLIQNADQIFSAINKIKNTTVKQAALKEIYSALTAASVSSGLTDKAK